MDKKGIILHPVTWIIGAFLVGFIVAILIGYGVIPLAIPVCP